MNRTLLIIAALAILAALLLGCILLTLAMSPLANLAAASTSAAATSDSTQVCIALLNLGACRSHQVTQTTPAMPAAGGWNGNPWPFVGLLTVVILGGTAAVLLSDRRCGHEHA